MKKLTQLLKSLSDEARLRILNLLMHEGSLCVCDLQRVVGYSQPKVSRHLAYLRSAGLVEDRRAGLWIVYSVTPPKDDAHRVLLHCLGEIFQVYEVFREDIRSLEKAKAEGGCVSAKLAEASELHPA